MKKRNGSRSPMRILAFAAAGGVTLPALVGVAVLLWRAASTGAGTPDLPVFVLDRPQPVREAYAYAIAHPEVTNHPAADRYPAWSPDGSRIAFASDRDGNWEIYTVDLVDGVIRNVTDNPATDDGAAWSPDGTRVAFASDRNGRSRVYVSRVGGAD